MSAQSSLF